MPPKKPSQTIARGRGKKSAPPTKSGEEEAPPTITPLIPLQDSETAKEPAENDKARSESPAPTLSITTQDSGSASLSPLTDPEQKLSKMSKKKGRREKEHANLFAPHENEMFEWLKENPVLYNLGYFRI